MGTLWERREIARKRAISPFPTVFYTPLKIFPLFSPNLKCRLQILAVWKSKICGLVKG